MLIMFEGKHRVSRCVKQHFLYELRGEERVFLRFSFFARVTNVTVCEGEHTNNISYPIFVDQFLTLDLSRFKRFFDNLGMMYVDR